MPWHCCSSITALFSLYPDIFPTHNPMRYLHSKNTEFPASDYTKWDWHKQSLLIWYPHEIPADFHIIILLSTLPWETPLNPLVTYTVWINCKHNSSLIYSFGTHLHHIQIKQDPFWYPEMVKKKKKKRKRKRKKERKKEKEKKNNSARESHQLAS